MADLQFDVCVVGGGPAGSVAALRLAKLGHRVCIVERCVFPRSHVGESLTTGIWPILDVLDLRELLLQAGFRNGGETLVRWAEPHTKHIRPNQHGIGLLVDRSKFDALLLQAAATAGVRLLQPGQVCGASCNEFGWRVEVTTNSEPYLIHAAFLVDATGRSGFLRGERERVSPRTLAVCGYLQGQACPHATLVEAQCDAWCWGAPIPRGLFSAMVFLDSAMLRQLWGGALETFWRSQLAKAELFADISQAPLVRPVFARDATTYYATDPIGSCFVRVGEASFSLDPLSSTGVEKAMHTGFIAAIALHTIIRWPNRQDLCTRFYRDRQTETVSAHAIWSSGFYGDVKRYVEFPFWKARSSVSEYHHSEQRRSKVPFHEDSLRLATRVRISDKARFVEEPCIVDDEIRAHAALLHPRLDRPVAFLEGIEVARLLDMVPQSPDLGRLLALWASRLSFQHPRRIATWLLNNQILETVSS